LSFVLLKLERIKDESEKIQTNGSNDPFIKAIR